ncbi:uncharacterized protein RCC_00504 [Ramularia collo-cygni]|uniref:Uncharacterized protein n=1 Tax=Ramularia collo-cygni TaxID=112498 RepID=A0A2D3USD1_9PEZI|nr:uncharacterized protein RCC_00504 [Ramularia collo-cygni]CZT14527.1 uncharacterized protein RCC_00504 [Ramularia collo-cygni]
MPSRRGTHGAPSLHRSTRSWTDHDGNHFTINSSSSGTGLSFEAMTGTSGDPFARTMPAPAAPRRASMFSNAFSMVEDMIALQQQQRAAFESGAQLRQSRTHGFPVDGGSETEGEDDGLAYGQHDGRRKSVLSRIKERLLDGKKSPRKDDGSSSSREESPAPSPKIGRRASAYGPDPADPVWSQQRSRPSPFHIVVEHDDEDSEEPGSYELPRKAPSPKRNNKLQALIDAVDNERQALRACKKKLEKASRQSNVTSAVLQQVIDEMKLHERSLADATNRFNMARLEQRGSRAPGARAPPRPRPQTYHPRRSQWGPHAPAMDDHYFPTFPGFETEPLPSHSQHRHAKFGAHEHPDPYDQLPRPQSFADFANFFQHVPHPMADDARFHLFDVPEMNPRNSQQNRTRYSHIPPPSHRQSHQFRAFTPPPTPPSPEPPSSLLVPAEAQRLFQSYNSRWKALLPTDPAIPYPARGLQASSLSARDSLWAPRIRTDVSKWNEETIMQANAQAFYLGVVGLKPEYSETAGNGQIECGFQKSSASPEQIKQLVEMLKKEKPRWHSDRLGRRNGGVMGGMLNETLQKDVRARAVFHAVCELMDRAQE